MYYVAVSSKSVIRTFSSEVVFCQFAVHQTAVLCGGRVRMYKCLKQVYCTSVYAYVASGLVHMYM